MREPIRQLEAVQPRLQHDRLAAHRIVVAVELEIGGDRRLRFTFDIDSKCEALIGAHALRREKIGDGDSLGGRRRRRGSENPHAVLEHRGKFRHRGVLGLVAVAQQHDSLVRFRRKQALGRGQRARDIGGARVGAVTEMPEQARIAQRREQPRVASKPDNPQLIAGRHRGFQLFDLATHPFLLVG